MTCTFHNNGGIIIHFSHTTRRAERENDHRSELRTKFSSWMRTQRLEHRFTFLHHRHNSLRDVLGPKLDLIIEERQRRTAVCNIPAFQTAVYSRLFATLRLSQNHSRSKHSEVTHVLSLACKSSRFVPITATGLFSAMLLAKSRAAFNTSRLPPSTTLETIPSSFASAAEKGRAECASS